MRDADAFPFPLHVLHGGQHLLTAFRPCPFRGSGKNGVCCILSSGVAYGRMRKRLPAVGERRFFLCGVRLRSRLFRACCLRAGKTTRQQGAHFLCSLDILPRLKSGDSYR